MRIEGDGMSRLKFKHAIVATGSRPATLPESIAPADACLDSTDALELSEIPKSLLVVGGGYIGLELGQVYASLGSKVTVVEMLDRICPGADDDLVRPLKARLKKQFEAILTSAKLERAVLTDKGKVEVTYSDEGRSSRSRPSTACSFPSAGSPIRTASGSNTRRSSSTNAALSTSMRNGALPRNASIAIGDVTGDPMLAHKASREGIVAAEAIAGHSAAFDPRAIPAVVYTSPEIAWCGVTEAEAKAQGLEIKVGKFPWGASGRAIAMGRPEGTTKIIADANTHRVLGVGIVGEHAGDLIAEAVLAMEMGAVAEDLAMTIHPHPATSETLMEAAESVFGKAIHSAR